MSANILHITNGDSTTNYLKKLNFSGDFITWREMLCEGKTETKVGSESFWKTRFDFLKSSYKITKKIFIDNTLKEYRNLCNKKENNEIVLWFEYDLFCQINMLAVISWLKRYRKNYPISLVCSGDIKRTKKMCGLSELNEEELFNEYNNRVELNQDDIEYADYIWQLYCSDSPLRLETVHKFNPSSPFLYLASALEAHLQRFPSIENGLNNVENFILNTVKKNKPKSKNSLVSDLINEQEIFGFADIQYQNTINQLKKSFASFNPVKLSKVGKQLLNREMNFYRELQNPNAYLGGTKKYSFLFNNSTHEILQITS